MCGYVQAHGLCFSVQEGIKVPPSLRNVFKVFAEGMDNQYQARPHFVEKHSDWLRERHILIGSLMDCARLFDWLTRPLLTNEILQDSVSHTQRETSRWSPGTQNGLRRLVRAPKARQLDQVGGSGHTG